MPAQDLPFRSYLCSVYLKPGVAALVPAFMFWCSFKPISGAPLSRAAWLLSYLPRGAFCYWPHELGHVIAANLTDSRQLVIAAGTGLEIALPLALLLWTLWKKEALLSWLVFLWLGYALLDVGYYIADAARPALVYVRPFDAGTYTAAQIGDSHDWIQLLKPRGLLPHARELGRAVYSLGIWLLWIPAMTLAGDWLNSWLDYRRGLREERDAR